MTLWKAPPKAKVFEALSAVADGRVRILSEGRAEVTSSSLDKVYRVRWSQGFATSNDNASKFQGYIGYPIIAVLLQNGTLAYEPAQAALLKGVPWKQLNNRFMRDYDSAVDSVLSELSPQEAEGLRRSVDDIFRALMEMNLQRKSVKSV